MTTTKKPAVKPLLKKKRVGGGKASQPKEVYSRPEPYGKPERLPRVRTPEQDLMTLFDQLLKVSKGKTTKKSRPSRATME